MSLGLGNKNKIYLTRQDHRSLTSKQKDKIKEEQGFKCAMCNIKFDAFDLEVHHKVEVHKSKDMLNLPTMEIGGRTKPKHDKRSNLEAVCRRCHHKTKSKKGRAEMKKAKKKVVKKKPAKKKTTKKKLAKKKTTKKRDNSLMGQIYRSR